MIHATRPLTQLRRHIIQRPPIRHSHRINMTMQRAKQNEELWALDFDGVICDSCGESSLSAWKAAARVWPELMATDQASKQKNAILDKMRIVRPVVETGYENIVQIRCLLEGMDTEEMLLHWNTILQERMEQWNLSRSELVELFGATRDAWMARDLASWLAPNAIFDGLPEALPRLMERSTVYIVTTKQARFTHVLLRDMAKIDFPMDCIISTTVSGQPKTEILQQLQREHRDRRYFFIEDKLSTLDKVCADDGLDKWSLYLADWGYNTAKERARASKNARIEIISLSRFVGLLENGVVPNTKRGV